MVRWVKNHTASAWVAVEGRIPSPTPVQWVKGSEVAAAVA